MYTYRYLVYLGGCIWGHAEIAILYRDRLGGMTKNVMKGLHCLFDLEREGYVDGYLYEKIGHYYCDEHKCEKNSEKATEYYRRAIDLGYGPAYISMYAFRRATTPGRNSLDGLLIDLLEAEEKGLRDDRILLTVLDDFCMGDKYVPSEKILGNFKTRAEMALHYCEVLIKRQSPYGYYWKGLLYLYGQVVPRNESKAVEIWEEADKLGMAHNEIYHTFMGGLVYCYMYVYM